MKYITLKSGYIIPETPDIKGTQVELIHKGKIIENTFVQGDIAIISTGGTISAYDKSIQSGVNISNLSNPELDIAKFINEDLLISLKNINENFVFYNPFNILSENLELNHISLLHKLINKIQENKKISTIIILHGTDNLCFSSCALFYTLKPSIPIILLGAQKSPDRPGSEYLQLILHAIKFSKLKTKGVFNIIYKSAGISNIVQPFYLIKLDTYARDGFISDKTYAVVTDKKVEIIYVDKTQNKYRNLDCNFKNKIIVLEVFPNIDSNIILYFYKLQYKIILIGTGIGHLPNYLTTFLKENLISVYIATRCLTGNTSNEVYSTSRIQNLNLLKNNLESNYVKLLLNLI